MAPETRPYTFPNGYTVEDVPVGITEPEFNKLRDWAMKQPVDDSLSAADVVTGAAKNFRPSAGKAVSGMWGAVTHPLQTADVLGEAAIGGINKLMPEGKSLYWGRTPETFTTGEDTANAIGQMYKDQYGSGEKIKKTIATDPVAPLLDALGIVSLGSGQLLKLPGIAGKIGRGAKILEQAPAKAVRAVLTGAEKAAKGTGRGLTQRAFTWDDAIGFEGRDRAIDYIHDARAGASRKGVELMDDLAAKDIAKVESILDSRPQRHIKPDRIFEALDDLSKDPLSKTGARSLDKSAAGEALEIGRKLDAEDAPFYTLRELNNLKKDAAKKIPHSSTPLPNPVDSNSAAVNRAVSKAARDTIASTSKGLPALNKNMQASLGALGPLYATAFKGATTSERPIMASAAARAVVPKQMPVFGDGPVGGLLGMVISPRMINRMGIWGSDVSRGAKTAADVANSPLLKKLTNVTPPGGYYASRLTEEPKKRKKKKKK